MFEVFPPRLIMDIKESPLQLTPGNTSPMEELVSAIRENLKLKAPVTLSPNATTTTSSWFCRSCASSQRISRRTSPYSIPSRENRRPNKCTCDLTRSSQIQRYRIGAQRKNVGHEEPYELLQALLKQGTLISEAVRRLQDPQKPTTKQKFMSYRSPSSVESLVTCDSSKTITTATTTVASTTTTTNTANFLTAACAAI